MPEDDSTIHPDSQSGGVNITGGAVNAADIVGRDKTTVNQTVTGNNNIVTGTGNIIVNVPPPPRRTHTIPAPPADFTGRVREVEQLLARTTAGASTAISGVSGMGGIGKTALAYYVAAQLRDRHPDAQLLLDMQGTGERPLSASDALAQVIRAFEPQADLRQASEDDLIALYRSLLDDQRVLLLLDNARDAAQCRPLLPPASCALLVTSRRHFVLPGLQPLRLDVMSEADAVALLQTLCPRLHPTGAEQIARLCGYLPLALRIAGSHLAVHDDLAPATYIRQLEQQRLARLKSDDDPNADVEQVLDLSYARLTPDLQARWRTLAVFPAPFDLAAAAAVWELEVGPAQSGIRRFLNRLLPHEPAKPDRDAAQSLLSELRQLSLVEYEPAPPPQPSPAERERETGARPALGGQEARALPSPVDGGGVGGGGGEAGRYALHDLLHDLAAARVTPAERDVTAYRHAAHYLQVARNADQLYQKGGDHILAGLALFDAELAHIRAGQAWAAAHAAADAPAANLCMNYPYYAAYVIDLRLHSREQIAWPEAALAAARTLNDKGMQGIHLGNLGRAYADLGAARKAIAYYEQALAIDRDIGDRHNEGTWLGNLGRAYKDLGETRKAITYHEQALALARDIGDRRNEGIWLGNLGNAYQDLDEVQKAIEYYAQALRIARDIGDRRAEGAILGNLGNAYKDLGEVQKAIAYYEQALALARDIGDRQGEGNALFNLSLAQEQLGDLPAALACAEQALEILTAIEAPLAKRAREQVEDLRGKMQGGA
ncbi:MAG: tetratricopeptide repeat protein [Anaerolineae bacterium]